jgi:Fe-S-cluster-containing dehydrogenase component
MNKSTILVDLQRCTGCWTCAMACKVANNLDDDDWRITVRTLGSGEGIDRPAGIWPNLHESWLPIWQSHCTKCPDRLAGGEEPFCVHSCPNGALSIGDVAIANAEALHGRGFAIFTLPAFEGSREDVVYGRKE